MHVAALAEVAITEEVEVEEEEGEGGDVVGGDSRIKGTYLHTLAPRVLLIFFLYVCSLVPRLHPK